MDEARAYRRALGAFATGVTVVCAEGPEGAVGITVNSFTSVSLVPRLVLWCLDDASDRYPLFAGAERWSVTVLPAGDDARAMRFAVGEGYRIAEADLARLPDGVPALPGGLLRLSARTVETRTLGDHLVIVGEVVGYEAAAGDALTFFRGQFGTAIEGARP